jgi:3-hydroxybutyryl-CoA dehydrogenase
MSETTLAVCGAGIMGHGIAQVGAMAGLEVRLADVDQAALERARASISASLAKLEAKGKLTAPADEVIGRIRVVGSVEEAAAGASFVIEAVPESIDLKRAVFARLEAAAPAGAVLATNTSQYSITAIASAVPAPARGRVVGMHWFSPAVLMRLVEVVRGLETSDETVDRTLALARDLGKTPILCRRDSPGFVTTRLIAALSNEAQHLVEEGLASVEDVDTACRLAFGHPMGPFETADLTGLDTQLRVREALYAAHGDRFRPSILLRTLVAAGHLGRKTGRGFYAYSGGDKVKP